MTTHHAINNDSTRLTLARIHTHTHSLSRSSSFWVSRLHWWLAQSSLTSTSYVRVLCSTQYAVRSTAHSIDSSCIHPFEFRLSTPHSWTTISLIAGKHSLFTSQNLMACWVSFYYILIGKVFSSSLFSLLVCSSRFANWCPVIDLPCQSFLTNIHTLSSNCRFHRRVVQQFLILPYLWKLWSSFFGKAFGEWWLQNSSAVWRPNSRVSDQHVTDSVVDSGSNQVHYGGTSVRTAVDTVISIVPIALTQLRD